MIRVRLPRDDALSDAMLAELKSPTDIAPTPGTRHPDVVACVTPKTNGSDTDQVLASFVKGEWDDLEITLEPLTLKADSDPSDNIIDMLDWLTVTPAEIEENEKRSKFRYEALIAAAERWCPDVLPGMLGDALKQVDRAIEERSSEHGEVTFLQRGGGLGGFLGRMKVRLGKLFSKTGDLRNPAALETKAPSSLATALAAPSSDGKIQVEYTNKGIECPTFTVINPGKLQYTIREESRGGDMFGDNYDDKEEMARLRKESDLKDRRLKLTNARYSANCLRITVDYELNGIPHKIVRKSALIAAINAYMYRRMVFVEKQEPGMFFDVTAPVMTETGEEKRVLKLKLCACKSYNYSYKPIDGKLLSFAEFESEQGATCRVPMQSSPFDPTTDFKLMFSKDGKYVDVPGPGESFIFPKPPFQATCSCDFEFSDGGISLLFRIKLEEILPKDCQMVLEVGKTEKIFTSENQRALSFVYKCPLPIDSLLAEIKPFVTRRVGNMLISPISVPPISLPAIWSGFYNKQTDDVTDIICKSATSVDLVLKKGGVEVHRVEGINAAQTGSPQGTITAQVSRAANGKLAVNGVETELDFGGWDSMGVISRQLGRTATVTYTPVPKPKQVEVVKIPHRKHDCALRFRSGGIFMTYDIELDGALNEGYYVMVTVPGLNEEPDRFDHTHLKDGHIVFEYQLPIDNQQVDFKTDFAWGYNGKPLSSETSIALRLSDPTVNIVPNQNEAGTIDIACGNVTSVDLVFKNEGSGEVHSVEGVTAAQTGSTITAQVSRTTGGKVAVNGVETEPEFGGWDSIEVIARQLGREVTATYKKPEPEPEPADEPEPEPEPEPEEVPVPEEPVPAFRVSARFSIENAEVVLHLGVTPDQDIENCKLSLGDGPPFPFKPIVFSPELASLTDVPVNVMLTYKGKTVAPITATASLPKPAVEIELVDGGKSKRLRVTATSATHWALRVGSENTAETQWLATEGGDAFTSLTVSSSREANKIDVANGTLSLRPGQKHILTAVAVQRKSKSDAIDWNEDTASIEVKMPYDHQHVIIDYNITLYLLLSLLSSNIVSNESSTQNGHPVGQVVSMITTLCFHMRGWTIGEGGAVKPWSDINSQNQESIDKLFDFQAPERPSGPQKALRTCLWFSKYDTNIYSPKQRSVIEAFVHGSPPYFDGEFIGAKTPGIALSTITEPFVLIPRGDTKSIGEKIKLQREKVFKKNVEDLKLNDEVYNKGIRLVILRLTRPVNKQFSYAYVMVQESALLRAMNRDIPSLATFFHFDGTYEHLYLMEKCLQDAKNPNQPESSFYARLVTEARSDRGSDGTGSGNRGGGGEGNDGGNPVVIALCCVVFAAFGAWLS